MGFGFGFTLAASISLTVPTLSTAWAAAVILNGLPGTKPTAITRPSTPLRLAVSSATPRVSTSSPRSSTALASIAAPCWIIAPRISILLSASFFAA